MIINLDVTYNETTEMYEATPREQELNFLFTSNTLEFDIEIACRVVDLDVSDVVIHYNAAHD